MKERTKKASLNDCIRKFHDVTLVKAYEHEDFRYYDSAYRYLMELKELRASIKRLRRILKTYELGNGDSQYGLGYAAGAHNISMMVYNYLEREEEETKDDTV